MSAEAVASSSPPLFRPSGERRVVTSFAVDLHNHMPQPGSDYRGPMDTTGLEVVSAALAAGIDVLGVTDHFGLGFFHQVSAAATDTTLLVLPGTEVRLHWRGEEIHLVATFPREAADERVAEYLDGLGFGGEYRMWPPHHVVLDHDPAGAVRLADRLGAIVHVAHADRWFGPNRLLGGELLPRTIEASPVTAVEFLDLANAPALGELADVVALIQSSDSHRNEEIGRRRTHLDADELSFDGIRRALSRSRAGER